MAFTLLLVDDDPNILETAADVLEDAGFIITKASTGASALEQFQASPTHVAILDFNLPDTTGTQLAQEIQRINPKTKIILLTGHEQADLGAGIPSTHRLLTKPVDPPKLVQVVNELVEK